MPFLMQKWRDTMEEAWKDVVGFEGYYQISNYGNLRSVKRYVKSKRGYMMLMQGKNISKHINKYGYVHFALHGDGIVKDMVIHRIVAIAFIPNPHKYKIINHKDENRDNNIVTNLEWCTSKYNNNYGTIYERKVKNKTSRPVSKLDKDGKYITTYRSFKEAARQNNTYDSSIHKGVKHGYLIAGYRWVRAN